MLKRLELNGFKSFAGKTILEFPKGISAIVGPNGSGKSNVIDALRWLLGERDAKSLRGAKAEDLIFAGTPMRPRVGLAQASIYFDNSNSFFPVEFAEVAVARNVGRDGTSKYFLNKSEVRLRDIIDFFAKVRLGARGLIVIGQGASDLFIRATPAERREMIEEILGLREYQLKKEEAERRHKNTILNLQAVSALLEEIAPHLKILRRQTVKWEKRSELEGELKSLEHSFFGFRLAEINQNFSKIDPLVGALDEKIKAARAELKNLEAGVQKIEKDEPSKHGEVKKIRDEQNALFAQRSSFEKELGRLEAQLEFLAIKREDALDVDAGRAIELIKKIKIQFEKFINLNADEIKKITALLLEEINSLFKTKKTDGLDLEEVMAAKERLSASLAKLNSDLQALKDKEQTISLLLESQSAAFKKAISALEEKKNAIYALEGEKNKLLFERERWSLRHQDLEAQAVQVGFNFADLRAVFKTADAKAFADINVPDLEKRILRLRGELASIGDIDEATLKEAKETESRHMFLTTQSDDLVKALQDLENLRRDLETKIDIEFHASLQKINIEFSKLFELMFGGGKAKLKIRENKKPKAETSEEDIPLAAASKEGVAEEEKEEKAEEGIDIEVSIPRKRITGLQMLSGGERSLVSIAALFALVSVSPPPFLVLDEIDAALDERNARRFAEMLKTFSTKTQFVVVTHNRATMEVADVLYGVTMGEDGTSKVLSLKLEDKMPTKA